MGTKRRTRSSTDGGPMDRRARTALFLAIALMALGGAGATAKTHRRAPASTVKLVKTARATIAQRGVATLKLRSARTRRVLIRTYLRPVGAHQKRIHFAKARRV